MIIPNIWKNKSHVPNHQPGFVWISSAKHLVYKTNHIGGTSIWVMRKPFGAIWKWRGKNNWTVYL